MKVTYWTKNEQAYIEAKGIAKEFTKSIRYDLGNGQTITIKKDDILSVEEEKEEPTKTAMFEIGKYYCWSGAEIEIVGIVPGLAFVQGWKLTTEPIRRDSNGNEYIKLGSQTYYAYSKR